MPVTYTHEEKWDKLFDEFATIEPVPPKKEEDVPTDRKETV